MRNGSSNGAVDELLRNMLVFDKDHLQQMERDHAHRIRIGPAGRYGCRLLVRGCVVEFMLRTLPDESENFLVTKDGLTVKEPELKSELYQLARHRAAEVMIGVRCGHTEYNQRLKAKKKPTK